MNATTARAIRTTETCKGQPHHAVTVDGVEVAAAWPVAVRLGIFTLVVDGAWAGTMTEDEALAQLDKVVVCLNATA